MTAARYAEFSKPSPAQAREHERLAIEKSIDRLRRARETGANSRESAEAIMYLQALWTYFIEELNSGENELPPELRASLISIGIWMLKESDEIRLENSENYEGLIGVSEIIGHALAGSAQ